MPFTCFRPSKSAGLDYDAPEACRPKPRSRPTNDRAKSSKFRLNRHGSADSRSSKASTCSNASISKLAPCSRVSDPAIDAMMMPEPSDARPSRCLRLSNPKTYGDIVASMKCEKGCRDWRNFAVFYDDDVDMNKSADEVAKKVAAAYEKKWQQLNSFTSTTHSVDSEPSVVDE